MLLPLLAVLLFAQNALAQEGGTPTMAAAVQRANDGQDAEALALFQRLAATNPNDHDARIWIARLHERMGHPALAEPVYRSVLLEDGARLEALLGVGTSLVAMHRAADALEFLDRAEQLAPRNPGVLDALALAHAEAGHETRALDYRQRALGAGPSDRRTQALEAVRLTHAHRIEARGLFERFEGTTPDTHGGDVGLNLRLSDHWRVTGAVQVQRKFAATDQRGGGGLEWRWRPETTLVGQVLAGPGNTILPRGDYLGALHHTWDGVTWSASVRHIDFTRVRLTAFVPEVAWRPRPRLAVTARYAFTITDHEGAINWERGHTAHLRGTWDLQARTHVTLGYAHGIDDFDALSIDRVGPFSADTALAGLRVDLPALTSIGATYEYLRRDGGGTMNRVVLALAQRF